MDYYPQPRPVLYGTRGDEPPAQTQTAPVRTGPPHYPPAPPLAGDAPDPFRNPRSKMVAERLGVPIGLALLYAVASAYSLLQIVTDTTGFTDPVIGRDVLAGEIVISLIVIGSLRRLGGREYLLAIGLALLQIAVTVVFKQWQSPALWVAVILALYLLRPSIV